LTGKLVFESDTPMAMLLHHAQTRPTPPSERTETEIPAALETIILQCLEKDPNDRPGSAEELAGMLERAGLSTAWNQERARDWWDLHLPESGPRDAAETCPQTSSAPNSRRIAFGTCFSHSWDLLFSR